MLNFFEVSARVAMFKTNWQHKMAFWDTFCRLCRMSRLWKFSFIVSVQVPVVSVVEVERLMQQSFQHVKAACEHTENSTTQLGSVSFVDAKTARLKNTSYCVQLQNLKVITITFGSQTQIISIIWSPAFTHFKSPTMDCIHSYNNIIVLVLFLVIWVCSTIKRHLKIS